MTWPMSPSLRPFAVVRPVVENRLCNRYRQHGSVPAARAPSPCDCRLSVTRASTRVCCCCHMRNGCTPHAPHAPHDTDLWDGEGASSLCSLCRPCSVGAIAGRVRIRATAAVQQRQLALPPLNDTAKADVALEAAIHIDTGGAGQKSTRQCSAPWCGRATRPSVDRHTDTAHRRGPAPPQTPRYIRRWFGPAGLRAQTAAGIPGTGSAHAYVVVQRCSAAGSKDDMPPAAHGPRHAAPRHTAHGTRHTARLDFRSCRSDYRAPARASTPQA